MKKIIKLVSIFTIIIIISSASLSIIFKVLIFPKKYEEIVNEACKINSVDPNLVYAIIKKESSFKKDVTSKAGAKGLMQIMDTTAYDMSKLINYIDVHNIDLYDEYTNINIGTKYLSYLINYFKENIYLAVTAYNAGLGNTKNWFKEDFTSYTDFNEIIDNIKYKETKNYVKDVFKYYNYYTFIYK